MMLKYKPQISNELTKYHLNQFTPLLLAIMYQESQGIGNDPMQASESAGLKRNEINSPEKSIKQGVYHFNKMYKYGKAKRVDLDTIIQSYNMGPGYINFVAQHGFKNSEKLAKAYSELRVKKSPSTYSCGHNFVNFRYPYCFGDYTYAKKVKQKMPYIHQIIQKSMSL
ncbi:MAG: lysozyme family protein [Bacillota bacterium]|nr:lysozyme family protein [Bacillota bacterium]MDP4169457.1 lysozyme family protein [Bacillota bacterium]